jgi:hypothetical protein
MINEILFPIVLFIVVFSFECCLLYNPHNGTVNQLQTAKVSVSPTAETKVGAQSSAPLQHAPQLEAGLPETVNSPVTPKHPQLEMEKLKALPQTVQQIDPWKPNLTPMGVEIELKKTTRRRPKRTKSTTDKASTRKKKAIAQGAVLEAIA